MKMTVRTPVDEFKQVLINRYSIESLIPEDTWPVVNQNTFIKLAVVKDYLLFIIYYFIIYYLLFIIYCLLFIIYYLLFIIYYLLQEPTDIPSRKNLMRWVCARGWCVRRGSLL